MKVFILTEGGIKVGFGHVARCAGLCRAFEKKGILTEFLINGDKTVKDLLKGRKHKMVNWLNGEDSLFDELNKADAVIIDSYLAGIEFYRKLSQMVKTPVYIDDERRINYPRGIVVNGSVYARRLNYPKTEEIIYLIGCQYALLREEFWHVPEKRIKKDVKTIMITLGGADLSNIAPAIMRFLTRRYPGLTQKVAMGKDASGMKRLMLESDIAISTGGQTLYELARAGVPTIGICVADNQILNLEGFKKAGFVKYIGRHNDEALLFKLKGAIDGLFDYKARVESSEIGRSLIGGAGATKVADYVIAS